jgi:type II secretory pathway component PulJ
MSRLAQLRKSDGFTLTELVIGMALGMIVLLAAFTVADRSFFTNKAIADRQDSLQSGRNMLEQMTRQLRSLVCVNTTNAVTSADDNGIQFYTYLGDPTNASNQLPEWHTLSFSGTTLTEQDYKVTATSPSITTASTPYRTVKLNNVYLATDTDGSSIPFFRYYKYDPNQKGTGAMIKLTTPVVSASDQGLLADIKISFVVRPTGVKTATPQATTYADDVLWRSPDPDNPATVPCAPNS